MNAKPENTSGLNDSRGQSLSPIDSSSAAKQQKANSPPEINTSTGESYRVGPPATSEARQVPAATRRRPR